MRENREIGPGYAPVSVPIPLETGLLRGGEPERVEGRTAEHTESLAALANISKLDLQNAVDSTRLVNAQSGYQMRCGELRVDSKIGKVFKRQVDVVDGLLS